MQVVSVNTGLPSEVVWKGRKVLTGIFKKPVEGRIALRRLNIDGDRQADLSVHGGPDKAVYAYLVEHYDFWRSELGADTLPMGMFGENLTTEGVLETAVNVGDRFRIGTAELMVTQPRFPCYKLALRFGRDDMVKRFLASGRTGFYFAVTKEGEIGAGDKIEPIDRDGNSVSIPDIIRLYVQKRYAALDIELARRAAGSEALPESWRHYLLQRIAENGEGRRQ